MNSFHSAKSSVETLKSYLENEVLDNIYPPPTTEVIKSKCQKPRKLIKPRPENLFFTTLNAEPLGGTHENVFGSDGRTQVLTTTEWPYSVHGIVATKFKHVKLWGTGTLIGPNVVLTAGHNLYNYDDKEYSDRKSLQFLPAVNGQNLPFGAVEVEKYFVSPDYIKEGKEDYGILILKKPIGEKTGFFGLACLKPEELASKIINITGYPGDKVESKPQTYEMWGMEGSVSHIDADGNSMYYMIDTAEGQSGSGIYYQEDQEYFVCGVHAFGAQFANIGTILTQKAYSQIFKWIQENVKKEWLFYLPEKKELTLEGQQVNKESISVLFEYNLDELRNLNLYGICVGAEGVRVLVLNNSWINLSKLSLSSNQIGDEGAKTLALNTFWINLSQLDLDGNNIGEEGAKALARNTSWTNLSQFNLEKNDIGDEGAIALAQNKIWINLSHLNLSWNKISAARARTLVRNISWIHLSQLNLSGNEIGRKGAEALALKTFWKNLSQLNLSFNNIGNRGAEALAQTTDWINLLQLDLDGNNIGVEGVKALMLTSWTNLSNLSLSSNRIDDEGAIALAHNTSWTNLSKLNLGFNNIGEKGAVALAEKTSWANLSQLNLENNSIGMKGATAIARNRLWVRLTQLNLEKNNIGDEGAIALAQNTSWTELSHLNLNKNNIGEKGAFALAQNTYWTNLSILDLAQNPICLEGALALAKNTGWIKLSQVTLDYNYIMTKKFQHTASEKANIKFVPCDYPTREPVKKFESVSAKDFWTNDSVSDLNSNDLNNEEDSSPVDTLVEETSWKNSVLPSLNNIAPEEINRSAQSFSDFNVNSRLSGEVASLPSKNYFKSSNENHPSH